jgi:hypothetical protein
MCSRNGLLNSGFLREGFRMDGPGAASWDAIDLLNAHVAVLDAAGRVIEVNNSWRRFGRQNNAEFDYVGYDYVEVCRKAARLGDRAAARAQRGLEGLLSGRCQQFSLAYHCAARTFRMRARTISHPVARILVAHEDLTPLLIARRERNRARTGLASARREHAETVADVYEEMGQNLAAIALAALALDRAGANDSAVATIHMAVDEAKRELKRLRHGVEREPSDAPGGVKPA